MDELGGTHTNSRTSSDTGLITLVESMPLAKGGKESLSGFKIS